MERGKIRKRFGIRTKRDCEMAPARQVRASNFGFLSAFGLRYSEFKHMMSGRFLPGILPADSCNAPGHLSRFTFHVLRFTLSSMPRWQKITVAGVGLLGREPMRDPSSDLSGQFLALANREDDHVRPGSIPRGDVE